MEGPAGVPWLLRRQQVRKASAPVGGVPAELEQLDYRSKKALTGQVRIVTFPGADCCACCGTHVLRAGQVGIIKVLSCQKFRSGVRMEILCGERAWRYLSGTYDQAHAVGQHLSVKPLEAAAAVERLTEELTAAKARMAELEGEVFSHKAHAYCGKGDVVLVEPPLRPDGVRRLADAVAKECGGLAAVFAGEDGRYTYALVRADGADIAPLVDRIYTVTTADQIPALTAAVTAASEATDFAAELTAYGPDVTGSCLILPQT